MRYEGVCQVVVSQANSFIADLFGRLRERMIDLKSGKAIFVGGKKQCRFMLQFCETDPRHPKVAKILNRQGRRKAQYLVNAMLSYENEMGEDANKEKIPTDFNRLEAVVNQILKEKLGALRQQEKNTASPSEKLHKTEEFLMKMSYKQILITALKKMSNHVV